MSEVSLAPALIPWYLLLPLLNLNEPHNLEATQEDLTKTEKLLGTSWMGLVTCLSPHISWQSFQKSYKNGPD